MALGWSGNWAADFGRDAMGRVSATAGMPNTHFILRPGERVRSPRVLLLHYVSDELIDGHNQFRQLMLDHYVPRREEPLEEPPVACNSTAGLYARAARTGFLGNTHGTERAGYDRHDCLLGCEAYWLDAYWYPQPWHENLGNWFPGRRIFPTD